VPSRAARAETRSPAITRCVSTRGPPGAAAARPGARNELLAAQRRAQRSASSWSARLRDAVRLQFPVSIPAGAERPHFLLGGPGQPVALWHWRADLNERGGNAVVKERGEGWERPVAELPAEAQDVSGQGVWAEGRWRVLMTRPLVPKDPATDVTFEPGRLVPFAVHAWDGANGEKGLMPAPA